MVKGIEKTLVRPRVVGRMESFVARVTGVHLGEERERAVEMGIPSYRTSSEECYRREGDAGVQERLHGG